MAAANYLDDCIHLHACRRVQRIGKSRWHNIPRYCNEDCECYKSQNEITHYVAISEAMDYARRGASLIREGYDSYDVYASEDLVGTSIGDILGEE